MSNSKPTMVLDRFKSTFKIDERNTPSESCSSDDSGSDRQNSTRRGLMMMKTIRQTIIKRLPSAFDLDEARKKRRKSSHSEGNSSLKLPKEMKGPNGRRSSLRKDSLDDSESLDSLDGAKNIANDVSCHNLLTVKLRHLRYVGSLACTRWKGRGRCSPSQLVRSSTRFGRSCSSLFASCLLSSTRTCSPFSRGCQGKRKTIT